MKTCSTCNVEKDLSSFKKAPRSLGGYLNSCNPCLKEKIRKKRESISQEELKKYLSYNPDTGEFVWLKRTSPRRIEGQKAGGTLNKEGYHQVQFKGVLCRLHRLAWFYMHNEWPEVIDHINGDRSDKRICNLRKADHFLNMQNTHKASKNNKLGVQGVYKVDSGKYQARIFAFGKTYYLGKFWTIEEASNAYKKAKAELHVKITNKEQP